MLSVLTSHASKPSEKLHHNLSTISRVILVVNKLCGRPPQYAPARCKLTFDLEGGVRVKGDVGYLFAILVFLGPSVLDLGPMYATDRQTSDAHHRLMPPTQGAGA